MTTTDGASSLERQIRAAQATLAGLAAHRDVLERAAAGIVAALAAGGKLLACGNGGSAAEAQHLVTELVGRYLSNRRSLPAVFLGGDAGMMSCIGNDFSFDDVFARPLSSLAAPGDLLVCFTTSGNPQNVVRALEVARQLSIRSLALLGKDGGRARGLADWEVVVASADTARIQEAHQFILHWICDRIEEAFPPA
jgi:D-sedoheptulose 7-phosphate isomerase